MSRVLSDTLINSKEEALGDAVLTFVAWSTSNDAGTVARGDEVTITADGSGVVTQEIQNGEYQVFITPSGGSRRALGRAVVSDGAAVDLAALLGYSGQTTSEVLAAINAASRISVYEPAGVTHTLRAIDEGVEILFDSASACTLTVPQQSSVALIQGAQFFFRNKQAGAITIATEGSDQLVGAGSVTSDATKLGGLLLESAGAPNRWVAVGDLTTP